MKKQVFITDSIIKPIPTIQVVCTNPPVRIIYQKESTRAAYLAQYKNNKAMAMAIAKHGLPPMDARYVEVKVLGEDE